jgi:hypothetical protein
MSNIVNPMKCCDARRGLAARSWKSAGGCVGSGAMLVLLPKCPMCVAAYIAVWTGAGIAAPIAGNLRFVMAIVFVASLGFLVVRRFLPEMELMRKGGSD